MAADGAPTPSATGWKPPRATPLVVLRSLLLLVLVIASLTLLLPACVFMILPRAVTRIAVRVIVRGWLGLLRLIVGLGYEVRGLEHLPDGACLIAAKHQSAFETLALQVILKDPAFVLKRELTWIPVAGWGMWRLGHIAINRAAGASALMDLIRQAKQRVAEGRQVVIFPEGTRSTPLSAPTYRPGVAALYRSLQVPCVPVALNSGVFWPRNSAWKFPGRITIEFLPTIPAGLSSGQFMEQLEQQVETRTDALVRSASGAAN
jgi:1-acyl-sn-glycerol-3-phosphate acyltransferase